MGADKLTLWIPHTPPATVLWLGTTPSVEECLARCDVHDVQHASGLPAYLVARLPRVRGPLYALRPDQLPDFDGFERMRPRLDVDVAALCPAMDEARLIKDDFEVAMIRRACEVSAEAHRAVAKALAGCVNECQIEAAFLNSVCVLPPLFTYLYLPTSPLVPHCIALLTRTSPARSACRRTPTRRHTP